MPSFNVTALNEALNGVTVAQLSLHSQYSASGAFELIGGTPAYARQATTPGSADSGERALVTNAAPVIFNVPAGSTVAFIGMWDGLGVFRGMVPISDGNLRLFVMSSDGVNLLMGFNPYISGSLVVLWTDPVLGLPQTLDALNVVEGNQYYVVNPTADTIQLALTLDGAGLVYSSTSAGGYLQQITPISFVTQDSFTVYFLGILGN